jgi:superfamily II DNA/RNA helicase
VSKYGFGGLGRSTHFCNPGRSVRKARKIVRKARKSVRKAKKGIRKARKSVRKARKSVQKVRKSVRKARKSVRKARKSVRKVKKSVRKSRKTASKVSKSWSSSLFFLQTECVQGDYLLFPHCQTPRHIPACRSGFLTPHGHPMGRHENSWRHGRHASGTIREMMNHNGEDHKFASFLIMSIYDYIIASFSGLPQF